MKAQRIRTRPSGWTRRGPAVAALILATLLPLFGAGTALAATMLQLAPNQGPAGAAFVINGSGFAHQGNQGEPISLAWDQGQQLGQAQADGHGSFTFSAHVPSGAAPGVHQVVAAGASGDTGNAPFTVTQSQASPSPVTHPSPSLAPPASQPPGPTAEPSPSAQTVTTTTSPHVARNPITGDWPKLSDDDVAAVDALIKAGKKQDALDELVKRMKKYCCNFDTMANGAPTYNPKVKGEGETQRKKGGTVEIGDAAFVSVAWLYSSLKHEMVHSMQWQDPDKAKDQGRKGREQQAYQREIEQAGNTGITDAQKTDLQQRHDAY